MKKSKELVLFLVVSLSILFVFFYLHQSFIEQSEAELTQKLKKSYLVSSSLLLIGLILFRFLDNKMKDRLGFIFLFWVIAKFMITYKLLYNDFKSDGEVTKIELFAIVLPYLLALITLTFYVSRLLNKYQDN